VSQNLLGWSAMWIKCFGDCLCLYPRDVLQLWAVPESRWIRWSALEQNTFCLLFASQFAPINWQHNARVQMQHVPTPLIETHSLSEDLDTADHSSRVRCSYTELSAKCHATLRTSFSAFIQQTQTKKTPWL
jgi:hypothetical protein